MRIGQLREQIALQQNTPTVDAHGQPIASWATTATVYARLDPLSGREFIEGARRDADITHRITIRYRADITPTTAWRILYGTRVFDIEAVLNLDERDRVWQIMAREVLT